MTVVDELMNFNSELEYEIVYDLLANHQDQQQINHLLKQYKLD